VHGERRVEHVSFVKAKNTLATGCGMTVAPVTATERKGDTA
jgi:hypothetical protein